MSYSQFAQRLEPSAIRAVSKAIHGKKVISFAGGMPHPGSFPSAEIGEITAEILQDHPGEALQYGMTQGYHPLLETVAAYMDSRGVKGLDAKNILIAAGSQQAIDLVARLLIDPGDVILMESPGYPGASAIFHNLGAKMVGIPVLADGPDLDALEEAIRRHKPRFFYTTPNFANPAGVLMSMEKRKRIADMAARYDIWIVEDDAYGELYFSEISGLDTVPLKAFDQANRVIYMQTFSKTIAPGLRVAAIVAPAETTDLLEMTKQSADMFTSTLTQMIAHEFIVRGRFAARLPALRTLYQGRRDAMHESLRERLPQATWVRPKGGFFFWLEMPESADGARINTQLLLTHALDWGVAFMPGASFYVGDFDPSVARRTARLAYSRETEGDIRQGIERLGKLIGTPLEIANVR